MPDVIDWRGMSHEHYATKYWELQYKTIVTTDDLPLLIDGIRKMAEDPDVRGHLIVFADLMESMLGMFGSDE